MNAEPSSENTTWHHLQRFTECGCERSFRTLFDSHAGLVYHAALRAGRGDRQLAEDVVQTVFASLARKAATFSPGIILTAWLHRHACLTTRHMMRTARRRQIREEASAVILQHEGFSADHISEVIDEALNSLPAPDRSALALRFLENKDFRTVGRELGISDDTAQKRVSRGLDRLRAALERRGVKKISTSVAGAVLGGSASAVPPDLGLLAESSLKAAAIPTFPIGAGSIAFLSMKTSSLVAASILTIAIGAAVITLTRPGQSESRPASTKPVAEKSQSTPDRPTPGTSHRLEITATKGSYFPKSQIASKPVSDYDKDTREAFQKHPMTRVAQDRINAMRSVTQGLINRMGAAHNDKLELYQELQAVVANPGSTATDKAEAGTELEKLSVQLKEMDQERINFKKSMDEMLNRNLADSMRQILAEIKNPSPPARALTQEEISTFNRAENLLLNGNYSAAEGMFTTLADNTELQAAPFARWKMLLSRALQGKATIGLDYEPRKILTPRCPASRGCARFPRTARPSGCSWFRGISRVCPRRWSLRGAYPDSR